NGRNKDTEDRLKKKFPPIHAEVQQYDTPGVVTDIDGVALTWYLPGIIGRNRRQAIMWEALSVLEPELQLNKSSNQWRVGPKYYRSSPANTLKPGTASFAPAWFEQGHDTEKYPLRVSKALVKKDGPANQWLERMTVSSALIGGILSIVQPDLYEAGRNAFLYLNDNPDEVDLPERLREVLQIWTAPFHGVSVISNRITPVHRDSNSGVEWMDILVALGTYQRGTLELGGLGVSFQYDPGTVVAIAGRVIAHAAKCNGDRACIAYYMREKVHRRLGLVHPRWFKLPDI
ncbi:hypothetical protein GALMADRAFT_80357, partial [Galerina marginata CBS 339.88]